MHLIKKINLKKYLLLSGISFFFILIISDHSLKFFLTLIMFSMMTFLNQLMLMGALDELLKTPIIVRRMDRLPMISRGRKWKAFLKSIRIGRRPNRKKATLRKKRIFRYVFKSKWKRKLKNIEERRYHWNLDIRRNSWKIVFLIMGKLIILMAAIGFGVHFIGDRIILPVINYVLQILALALSIKKGTLAK